MGQRLMMLHERHLRDIGPSAARAAPASLAQAARWIDECARDRIAAAGALPQRQR
jgi:hypothetical protein